jgi:hypothetical protein
VESSRQISADLKSILLEKHQNFELLNTYKGVPFICKAVLQAVEEETACFDISPGSSFAWETVDATLILSEGLLEPIEAHRVKFDQAASQLWVDHFVYAGSKLSNRKELRVEPEGGVEILLEAEGVRETAYLADLSMRGAGMRLDGDLPSSFLPGKILDLRLLLEEGEVKLNGRIRSISRAANANRLSVEFIGSTPDKALIVRFIMRRRAEIIAEMQKMTARE